MPVLLLIVKSVHILSVIVALGFNISYAVWIVRAQRDSAHLEFALRGVKFLDDFVANPAYALVFMSGLGMVFIARYQLTQFWLWGALVLFALVAVLAFGFYTPMLRKQIRTLAESGASSVAYQRVAARAMAVGVTISVMVVVILALMVFKPAAL